MELRQLRYFEAVARHLHFSKAAKELNMSQPPLSLQVSRLESELGVRLLERTSRTVRLTREGEWLLPAVRRVLEEGSQVRDIAKRLAEGTEGELLLGVVFPALHMGLSKQLRRFRAEHPDLSIKPSMISNVEQVDAIRSGQIDIGVTMGHAAVPNVTEHVLSSHRLAVVLPSDHRLAGSVVSLQDLADEVFLASQLTTDAPDFDYTSRACAEAGFVPRVARHGPQLSVLIHLVAAGFGVTLATESDQCLMVPGAVLCELQEPAPRMTMSIIHRVGLLPGPSSAFKIFLSNRQWAAGAFPD